MVNCGLIGILEPVHRIFPDITPQQQIILFVVLEVTNFMIKNTQRDTEDNGVFITLVSKGFLIRWLNNFGDFTEF